MKFLFSISLISFFLINLGCLDNNSSNKIVSKSSKSNFDDVNIVDKKEVRGNAYSDSTVDQIIKEHLSSSKPIGIDSFRDLHSFDKENFTISNCDVFAIDTTNKYLNINSPISKPQAKLLSVTDYFIDKTFSDVFKTYIFYKKSMESHYGNSIVLFTINNNSNSFHNLLLSEEYLSEGYERRIESKFTTKNQIMVKSTEFFNTSDLDKTNDSIRVTRLKYKILKDGNIKKVSN